MYDVTEQIPGIFLPHVFPIAIRERERRESRIELRNRQPTRGSLQSGTTGKTGLVAFDNFLLV